MLRKGTTRPHPIGTLAVADSLRPAMTGSSVAAPARKQP